MSVILCSANCGALTPATTLPASVRKTRFATRRPVGVSRGICHVPINGATSAGVTAAAPDFAPAAPGAGAAGLAADCFVARPPAWACPVIPTARAEPLVTKVATSKYVEIRRNIKVLLTTYKNDAH